MQLLSSAEGEGRQSGIRRLPTGLLAHAAVLLEPVGRDPGAVPTFVAVGLLLPPDIAANLKAINTAVGNYRKFRAQRRDLVRFYVTLIGLIFLATLFVAIWIGFYVTRRITVPVQEMAAAAREISAGNLGVRVQTQVGDELGMLIDAFNEMAGELQENREVITRSTAELRRSNQALDERRRYVETLVANLSTAVISLDPRGRVTTANPAVHRLLGVRLRTGDEARSALAHGALAPLADLMSQVGSGESVRRDLELPEGTTAIHVSVQVSPLVGRAAE